ncbi:extracellular solute-binding protein [Rhizobium sophoriradicis]|uniref:extracellular solute-binding protein n=1 Tax=Rhizobium TaxID=379 RepID=UPI00098F1DF4|nr:MULTISPECIES: extracellular solute-binding protein [Rhizobium]ARQ58975.1 ABC transporter substrate-binding protein [Rhizobium sp. Kim5]RSC01452.1 extracellular solute-binding protein [Rhizobium sophoriradicis]
MKTIVSAAALLAASLFAIPASAANLVLYTSQPNEDAQATVDGFMAANPDIKVDWVRDGTPKIIAKLQAEIQAGNPVADLLLIADMVTLERLKEEGKLLAYKSPEAAQYEAGMKPASWKDLTKPEAKGLVTMPSPLASGAALIHAQTLAAVPGLGWDFYKSLQANGAIAAGGNGAVLKSVASGEKAYGVVVDYLPIREKAKGAPVEFVFPSEGVSAVTEPVGILASSKNAEAAKKFVDYVLSEKGQEGFLKLGYIPARNGMKVPEGFPARETIKVLPVNAAEALKNTDQDLKTFSGIYGSN